MEQGHTRYDIGTQQVWNKDIECMLLKLTLLLIITLNVSSILEPTFLTLWYSVFFFTGKKIPHSPFCSPPSPFCSPPSTHISAKADYPVSLSRSPVHLPVCQYVLPDLEDEEISAELLVQPAWVRNIEPHPEVKLWDMTCEGCKTEIH